jgi:glycosyltransferase involved in cell wall biosynthesis
VNILFVTPVPPLLMRPRPHHFLRGLAARGHSVHLLTQVSSPKMAADLQRAPGWKEVAESCSTTTCVAVPKLRSYIQCAASIPSRTPLRVAYCRSTQFVETAWELIQQHDCDILHVDRERLAPYFNALPSVTKILDPTDSITLYLKRALKYGPPFERLISAFELLKVPAFESTMADGYAACLATSEEDASAIRCVAGGPVNLQVLPNGIKPQTFERHPSTLTENLLFVGQMYYAPNVDAVVWFTKHVFGRIRAVKPRVRLYLVGYRPKRSVRRLGRIPGVEVTGTVKDIKPYLERATAFVAPMRIGGGFPNKVAEALAAGIPTVATPTAHRGIPGLVPGEHLIEANNAEDFASKTIQLLEDPDLRGRLGRSGQDFIQANYGWDRIIDHLENIYINCLQGENLPGGGPRP